MDIGYPYNFLFLFCYAEFCVFFGIIWLPMYRREGKLYYKTGYKTRNTTGIFTMQLLFFCCIISVYSHSLANPGVDFPPSFIGGPTQTFTVCENSMATAIYSELSIIDSDYGQTETWTVISGPAHGSLTGFPVSATSTGGSLTPSSLYFTPVSGYSGTDSFRIQVTDGLASATTTIIVSVNPIPSLSSTHTPPAVCDGSLFSYTPASSATGAIFSWHRVFVPGLSNPTASGTGNPNETLSNVTNSDVSTTYIFTITSSSCSSTANVVVIVHPTPRLSGSLSDTVCSGSVFNYFPTSPNPGFTWSWSRDVVPGITPAAASSGTGNIIETLGNTTAGPLTAIYTFTLTAGGCSSIRNLIATVYPEPAVPLITTSSPSNLCSGTQFQNFGAGSAPAAGSSYTWSAQNAIIWQTGSTSQYCLVNFPEAGNAIITLSTGSGNPCAGTSSYSVNVGSDISATYNVIYYNFYFIFQDNTQDNYQWGYDDVSTLDSSLIPGATFQSYANLAPDFFNKYYWVITTKNGCMQKTYFNGPLAIVLSPSGNVASLLKITPNPASSVINIATLFAAGTTGKIVLTDITGHVLLSRAVTGNTMQLDISSLPPGCYLVSSYNNEVKISTSRFIKNME